MSLFIPLQKLTFPGKELCELLIVTRAIVVEFLSWRHVPKIKICCRQAVDKSYLRFGVKNIGMLRTQRQQ